MATPTAERGDSAPGAAPPPQADPASPTAGLSVSSGTPATVSAHRSARTTRNIERAAGSLGSAAVRKIEAELPWYSELGAQERSWVGLLAQAGIASFVSWYASPGPLSQIAGELLGNAPRELTGAISLRQTLDLVRTVVEVVEEHVTQLAADDDEAELTVEVLRYSREIAFAVARVYAGAAESRGAWDARLEALVVDAVLRGEADDELASRAAALGWDKLSPVAVVVGSSRGDVEAGAEEVRRTARRAGAECLLAVQGRRVILIIGGADDPLAVAERFVPHVGAGPLVVGPKVPHLFAAGRSARAALAGFRAAAGWPERPTPVAADELLPERILDGDLAARRIAIDRIARPLLDAGGELAATVTAYLSCGRNLEATARQLFVHPNTVRYRLTRAAQECGLDVTNPREAFVTQIALTSAAMDAATRTGRPL